MHTHVTVHAGAIETYIQAKRDTRPRWVAGLAVKAHLKVWLAIFNWAAWYTHLVSLTSFKDPEYLVCLCLRGVCHGIVKVDSEVDGASRSKSYRRAVLQRDESGCGRLPELTDKNLFWARGLYNNNYQ
jgi:hypothetical protein